MLIVESEMLFIVIKKFAACDKEHSETDLQKSSLN